MDQKSQAIEPVAVDAVVVENSQEKPTININILLASIARKAETSIEAVTSAEKALEIARKWEEHRLKSFKERSEAVISLKQRDPDDIEKRCNNRTRRILKYVIATGGVLGGCGMIVGVVTGASVAVVTLSGLIAAVCFGTLAPLASGESVSSTDVVRVIQAMVSAIRPEETEKEKSGQTGKKKRK
jgi:hypothetical protein